MKRILLFLVTNIAVLLVLSVTLRLLGIDRILDAEGVGINFNALLVMAGVIGFGGSFISLLMSKWTAKRATGAHVIEVPANMTERWLFDTVQRQAQRAGIGMPEVAIYEAPSQLMMTNRGPIPAAGCSPSRGLLRGSRYAGHRAVRPTADQH